MNEMFFSGRLRFVSVILLPALALLTVPSAHGAALNLVKSWPDISTASTDINNVFVNTDSDHVWQMTIDGSAASNLVTQNVQWFPGDVNHIVCASNVLNSACSANSTAYTLLAYFDAAGNFTTGSVTSDGYIDGDPATAGYQPNNALANNGSVLDATITEFGFVGTAGTTAYDQLKLEFRLALDNTTADFNQIFGAGTKGGVIWNGRVQTGQVNGNWAQSDFAHAFGCSGISGCGPATMDTFVPLPAAVWLFGSGLAGLFGFAFASRKSRSN